MAELTKKGWSHGSLPARLEGRNCLSYETAACPAQRTLVSEVAVRSENGQTLGAGGATYLDVMLDADTCYRAYFARDRRFDGTFFVAVRTTGIYCRPICPARTPRRDRVVFYERAAEAERAGFRACFRCRPEQAPGVDAQGDCPPLVRTAISRIEAGALDEGSIASLASDLGVTDRHLRRVIEACLGVTPIELAQSRRLGLAHQLVRDTDRPLIEVAFASGFASVRRFNEAYRRRFGCAPSRVRRLGTPSLLSEGVTVRLEYRPPFDWDALLGFLAPRAIPGVESVREGIYHRTIDLGGRSGWLKVTHDPTRRELIAEILTNPVGSLLPILAKLRALFDLDARPEVIGEHLRQDPLLSPSIERHPGLRVPGAFDGFETTVRAILGQQVSVRGATTLAGRFARAFGVPCQTPSGELDTIFPGADRVAEVTPEAVAKIGLPMARARALHTLACATAQTRIRLDRSGDPDEDRRELMELGGIGDWTAQYIAMRVLRSPDAFPRTDLGIRKALSGWSLAKIDQRAERWRPWRAYAAFHLWASLTKGTSQ